LKRVNDEVDLGITVTSNLSWTTHINKIKVKANMLLGLLRRTCPLLTDRPQYPGHSVSFARQVTIMLCHRGLNTFQSKVKYSI
jgi:hypothetical protein